MLSTSRRPPVQNSSIKNTGDCLGISRSSTKSTLFPFSNDIYNAEGYITNNMQGRRDQFHVRQRKFEFWLFQSTKTALTVVSFIRSGIRFHCQSSEIPYPTITTKTIPKSIILVGCCRTDTLTDNNHQRNNISR